MLNYLSNAESQRINQLIETIIQKENGIKYLEVLNQVQLAFAQLDTIKTSQIKLFEWFKT